MSVLRTKQDFADLAAAYFERAAAENVTHAELFFDPMLHVARWVACAVLIPGAENGGCCLPGGSAWPTIAQVGDACAARQGRPSAAAAWPASSPRASAADWCMLGSR